MRVLVYGAGAIGGYLGGMLAQAGADVTLLARGAQYEALSTQGLSIEWEAGRSLQVKVKACRPGETQGRYDVVFVTLKSMQLAPAAKEISAAVAADGSIVMIQNGLPWWYFERVDSPWRGTRLKSVDADGKLAEGFDLDRVVAAVIYKPVMVPAPGRVFIPKVNADRLVIGEIDNSLTPRLEAIAKLVTGAGLPTAISDDIRAVKWGKLMMNMVWNPLCALTQSPGGHIAEFPPAVELVRAMMTEGEAVARSVGVRVEPNLESELQRVAGNYTQQTSMLQDVRAGRPLEWDAILNAVIEVGALTGVPTPTLKNIAACVGLVDQRIRGDGVAFRPVKIEP